MPVNHRNRDARTCRIEPLEDRRLFVAGALDVSFSEDGKSTMEVNLGGITLDATDVAVQADGKTIVVGKFALSATQSDFGIARLNMDGTPDRTFGPQGNGFVRSPIGDGGRAAASAVAIQPDGRIVVVGSALQESGFDEDELAIARYMPDGSSDRSFDGDGVRTLDVGNFSSWSYANDVALQRDGKIVVVGRTYRTPNDDFFVVRFNAGGSLDRTFNGDGKTFIGFGDSDEARAVAIDEFGTPATNPHYGTIYVAGNASYSGSNARVGLVRLNASGFGVDSFGGDGNITFTFPGKTFVGGVLAQPGGKVVIAGHAAGDFFVARYGTDGRLDATFGGHGTGYRQTDFGGSESAGGIARAPGGGGGFFVSGGSGGFAVAKYTEHGRLDTTFGTGGKARVGGFGGVARIAAGPGKRITLASGARFAAARLLDAGANVVSVSPLFNSTAHEAGRQPASLFVYRSERLSVPTRVFLASSGTATPQTFVPLGRENPTDFTGWSNQVISIGGSPRFVDIPANQTFVELPITPIDDARVEGDETFRLTVLPSASYEIGVGSGTITIRDNEVTALSPIADAYVRDGSSAGLNFGESTELQVRNSSGNNRRTYLKFDLRSITTFGTAKLRLFGSAAGSGSVAVSAFGATDTSWSETGITFNNKPAPTGSALSSQTVTGTTARWYEWDLTSYITAAKAAGQTTVTIVLRNLTTSPTHATFASDESGDFRPQLWFTPRWTFQPVAL